MIVVSAASGAFGRLVVERLPARHPAGHVGVAVRAPGRVADLAARGVRVRHGDYADPHTLLRHPFHSEAFLDPGPRAAVARGELDDGTGGRGINTASRADLAEAAARVLTEDGHLGRAYDFTGTLGTCPELARVLTRVRGTTVVHRARQTPAAGAQGWLEDQVRSGGLERQTDDLHHVLGRPPTTSDQAVTGLLARPAPPAGSAAQA